MADAMMAEVLPQPQHSATGRTLGARGRNRPDEDKLTSPTALNKQEISVYVFSKSDVSLYDARKNSLTKVADGDHRMLTATRGGFVQDFVADAPVVLVIVADVAKFEAPADMAALMGAVDAGIVSQNINLFCAAAGLPPRHRHPRHNGRAGDIIPFGPRSRPDSGAQQPRGLPAVDAASQAGCECRHPVVAAIV